MSYLSEQEANDGQHSELASGKAEYQSQGQNSVDDGRCKKGDHQ